QGGQRWFHLYPSENMDHTNPLHWTGVNQNWNYMCAECHSTNLKKNYDSTTNSYKTNWSEIDVSCEACHGPASKHVEWANSEYSQSPSQNYSQELVVSFAEPEKDIWHFVSGKKTAQRTSPLDSRVQEEICARCHSRRGVIHNEYQHEAPFLDSYRLSLLEESLYHSDGQINDEVYVYGSFLQSKMHQAGVVCSDCHDPHSLKLKAEGNDLCTKCHSAIFFDQPSHHHHNVDSLGSKCVSCHMPAKEYMVVDPRRDHSFRIPRPDFSVSMGTPNACNQCHDDKTLKWSMDVVMEWFGGEVFNRNHFGESLHAGRLGLPKAAESLIRLAEDSNQPAIARASSIDLLSRFPSQSTADSIKKVLQDPDPLVRIAATNSLEMIHPSQRFELAESLLFDSVRAVRIEAGRVLSPVPRMELSEKQKSLLGKAIDEYIEAQKVNADHPSAHLNLGVLYSGLRNWSKAETEYKTSIKLDSSFVQGYINLADLYRLQGREGEGEEILRSGLEIIKDSPEILHSLGLLLVRNKRMSVAIKALEKAANLRRENPRFSFVYAVALNSIGQNEKALEFLQKAQKNHPYNRDILFTLVTINRDIGHLDSALKYVRRLIELEPKNSRFLSLEE
ncbi:MAG: tetratricopeptide repeat protein, partial [Desulfobacterales bacterium]